MNARWDVATGYANAVALADQLDDGRLLTYEGVGHTAYQFGTESPCVAKVVDDYLRGVAVPPRQGGATCPAVDPTPTSNEDAPVAPVVTVPTTTPPTAAVVPRFAG